MPFGIRIAYEALSWGRHVNLPARWDIVRTADRANLGVCIDSYHVLAHRTAGGLLRRRRSAEGLPRPLSDFLWQETRSPEDRMETARHYRVFPGEGVHSAEVGDAGPRAGRHGYRGDYSFEVFNDDYKQLPLPMVAERARRSVKWITGWCRAGASRRSGGLDQHEATMISRCARDAAACSPATRPRRDCTTVARAHGVGLTSAASSAWLAWKLLVELAPKRQASPGRKWY